jgi:hypothetical protein
LSLKNKNARLKDCRLDADPGAHLNATPSSALGLEMDVGERYRRYTANCLKIATQIQDETIKGSLLDMAQVWMKLAEQAERERPTKK